VILFNEYFAQANKAVEPSCSFALRVFAAEKTF